MNSLLCDLRHALRIYFVTPLQSVLAIATIALAIAIASSFFSFYNDLAIRGLPGVDEPNRLVSVLLVNEVETGPMSARLIDALSERSHTLQAVGGYYPPAGSRVIIRDKHTDIAPTLVTKYFHTGLGVRMAAGRGLQQSDFEEDGDIVAVVATTVAERYFGSAERALGREVLIDEIAFRIVGVAAAEFEGLRRGYRQELWVPLVSYGSQLHGMPAEVMNSLPLYAVGSLAPRRSLSSVQSELALIATELEADLRHELRERRIIVLPDVAEDPEAHRNAIRQVSLLVGTAVLLVLIVGVNLGLFLLSRMPARRHELAIRMSVGASLGRLVRQLVTEASLLVMVGAVAGILLTVWLAGWLRSVPFLDNVHWQDRAVLDWPVLLAVLVLTMLMCALVSLAPIVELRRNALNFGARQPRVPGALLRSSIVSLQLAIVGIVLAIAWVFSLALVNTLMASPGYDPGDTLVVYPAPTSGTFSVAFRNQVVVEAFRHEVQARLNRFPEVDAVAFTSAVPGFGALDTANVEIDSDDVRPI
jgi:hypothetical protein